MNCFINLHLKVKSLLFHLYINYLERSLQTLVTEREELFAVSAPGKTLCLLGQKGKSKVFISSSSDMYIAGSLRLSVYWVLIICYQSREVCFCSFEDKLKGLFTPLHNLGP